jgi:hypothetical protein
MYEQIYIGLAERYVLNQGANAFERYPCPWRPDMLFEFYISVKKL